MSSTIGTFLQQFYIYAVDFVDSGTRVGMKRKELEINAGHSRRSRLDMDGITP